MSRLYKEIFSELGWFTAVLIAVFLIAGLVFQFNLSNGTLDIHLHDTYFVVSKTMIFIALFLLTTFIFYFIRTIRFRFAKTWTNAILLLSGLLLIILITFVNKEVTKVAPAFGWTMYPPLSALPDISEEPKLNPLWALIINSLTILQLLITVSLLYVSFQWGRQTGKVR